MSDHSSGSKEDCSQSTLEIRNLLTQNNEGDEKDADQFLGILENGEVKEELGGEASSVVYQSRNSTFNRSSQRKNTDILDSAEVKDFSWTERYVLIKIYFRKNFIFFMTILLGGGVCGGYVALPSPPQNCLIPRQVLANN